MGITRLLVIVATGMLISGFIGACTQDRPASTDPAASTETDYDWVVLDDVNPALLTNHAGHASVFALTVDDAIKAELKARGLLLATYPELADDLSRYRRQFVGLMTEDEATVEVIYFLPYEGNIPSDARSSDEFWREELANPGNYPGKWFHVTVNLETMTASDIATALNG